MLVALPLLLRESPPIQRGSTETLVIIGPNNEIVRSEFGRAFAVWARRELHQEVVIDWRTPGGTSDIIKLVDEQFTAAFLAAHPELPSSARKAFNNAKVDPDDTALPEDDRRARRLFLASAIGIGLDLMFGGGEFDHRVSLAGKGYVVDTGLIREMPEVFRDDVMPQTLGGEIIYDQRGRYFASALASFGICYSPDRLAAISRAGSRSGPDVMSPRAWRDLGAPELLGAVAMADPTKSGSIANCYVMMLQEQLAIAVREGGATAANATPAMLDAGWRAGFGLIKQIAGNARYVTDSASRVPRDVGRGDAAAGMCIDFYGRAEAEWTRHESGRERLVYVTPVGGTSISADPISCFRGAPHPELAKAFMRFVLSVEAQKLWNYRVGEAGGPTTYALRRWPVRRDLYTPEHLPHLSDPDENPFELAKSFQFQGAWTGPYFDLIRSTIKAVALDPRPELESAWRAIVAAGGPQHVPAAMAEFTWLPFAHHEAKAAREAWEQDRVGTMRRWCIEAQQHFHTARTLAEAGH